MSSPERLIDARELAQLLGVRPQWVYGKVDAGELPGYRLGHYLRFRASEVEAWLERQRVNGEAGR